LRPRKRPIAVKPRICCTQRILKTTCWTFRFGSSFLKRNQRRNFTIRPWLRSGSSSVRVFSRIEPYSTPEGQAVSHARQSRHWSRWPSTSSVGSMRSLRMPFIR